MIVRKKPVEVEAWLWDGEVSTLESLKEMSDLIQYVPASSVVTEGYLTIRTLEGTMSFPVGWWVIKGVNGEFYACDPDVFDKTYDIV